MTTNQWKTEDWKNGTTTLSWHLRKIWQWKNQIPFSYDEDEK